MSAEETETDAPEDGASVMQLPVSVSTTGSATTMSDADPVEEVSEVDRLLPGPDADAVDGTVTLSDGTVVLVLPMKTRQFLKMLRIITRGGSNILPSLAVNFDGNVEQFATSLIAVVLFAIPEAEDATVEFVRSMVESKDADEEKEKALDVLLANPEIDDLVTIIEAIVRREASDLKALGKRLSGMMALAQKTGQIKQIQT